MNEEVKLTAQEINEIVELMKRAQITGNEAPRYVHLIEKLAKMHQQETGE